MERSAVIEAAARSGVEIRSLRDVDTAGGPRTLGHVVAADGWGAARFLLALCAIEARGDVAWSVARQLRPGRTDAGYVEAVRAFVRERVSFAPEAGEVFMGLGYLLGVGVGDCDDHARAVYAILTAGGVPARLAFLFVRGESGPRHVVVQAFVGGGWTWVETTVAAKTGEHPVTAARRLGLLSARSDLVTAEVVTMTEKDLPPVPAGTFSLSSGAQLAMDQEALTRLGFLCAPIAGLTDARDPEFRRAVLAFQTREGLKPDGLIGPKTRKHLAALFGPEPNADGFRYSPKLGAVSDAPGAVHSAYLSEGFFLGVKRMAAGLRALGANVTALDLLKVWASESELRPSANNHNAAMGLNQISTYPDPWKGLRAVGWTGTPAGYLALTAEDQLPYVARWYKNQGGKLSKVEGAAGLYLLNFLPALVGGGTEPDRKLVAADGSGPLGAHDSARFYHDNRGLDVNGDGVIDVADLARAIERKLAAPHFAPLWSEVVARLGESPDGAILDLDGAAGAVSILVGAVAIAGHLVGV